MQNVPLPQDLLDNPKKGDLTMDPKIFSILENALKRAASQDKHPRTPCITSVFDKKVLANLRRSMEYCNYVREHPIDELDILMNNDSATVYSEIAKLSTLSIGELRRIWKEKMRCDAPHYWVKNLFVEELTNLLQKLAFGDLSKTDAELLNEYKDRLQKGQPLFDPCKKLPAGIVLTKDYNGCRHLVKILEDEQVEYNGKIYQSLSAVARAITGVRWNGRKFFHVEKKENVHLKEKI
jgi:hypothetical protein